jgi:hypothetical protein
VRPSKSDPWSGITEAELALLDRVLREVRHAAATGQQLSFTFDPFADGTGAHLGFHYNGDGWTSTIEGSFKKRRKRSRRPL